MVMINRDSTTQCGAHPVERIEKDRNFVVVMIGMMNLVF
jgi:hypothetical protein